MKSLASKAALVNVLITDQNLDILCLTKTWIRLNLDRRHMWEVYAVNETTPPG